MNSNSPSLAAQAPAQSKLVETFKANRKTIYIVAGVLVAIAFARFIYSQFVYEDTDDAQVSAHISVLSARVSGIVDQVNFQDNESVKAGQVLVTIDSRDYQNAVKEASGNLGSVEARARDTKVDFDRMVNLFKQGAVTQQQVDNAQAAYLEAARKKEANAATVDQSKLNLSYTATKAPTDGRVGRRNIEPGMVVQQGQSIVSFVDATPPWVIANFKETQLRRMKIGQEAEIEIDAIEGKTFTGKVQSFSPGAGAAFALIPPDNATGNFTKIVQRVPVKVVFDADSIKGFENQIVPGISALVTVKVR